jgi:hypothetical protein
MSELTEVDVFAPKTIDHSPSCFPFCGNRIQDNYLHAAAFKVFEMHCSSEDILTIKFDALACNGLRELRKDRGLIVPVCELTCEGRVWNTDGDLIDNFRFEAGNLENGESDTSTEAA